MLEFSLYDRVLVGWSCYRQKIYSYCLDEHLILLVLKCIYLFSQISTSTFPHCFIKFLKLKPAKPGRDQRWLDPSAWPSWTPWPPKVEVERLKLEGLDSKP